MRDQYKFEVGQFVRVKKSAIPLNKITSHRRHQHLTSGVPIKKRRITRSGVALYELTNGSTWYEDELKKA